METSIASYIKQTNNNNKKIHKRFENEFEF